MLSVLNKDYPSGGNTVSCATRLELWVLYVWLKTDPPPETRFKKHQLILWSELSQDIFSFWDRTLNFYQSETDKIKTFAKKSLDVAQFLYLMVTRHLSFFRWKYIKHLSVINRKYQNFFHQICRCGGIPVLMVISRVTKIDCTHEQKIMTACQFQFKNQCPNLWNLCTADTASLFPITVEIFCPKHKTNLKKN